MHEVALVEALIDQVQREVDRGGHKGRVVQLDLKVGRLSGVHSDSLRFAFELISPETFLAGARMNIVETKAVCHCRNCDARTEIEDLLAECPRCHSREVAIEGGQDLLLESIELEDTSP